jgi:dATP/dGTP diphosphohydrolase
MAAYTCPLCGRSSMTGRCCDSAARAKPSPVPCLITGCPDPCRTNSLYCEWHGATRDGLLKPGKKIVVPAPADCHVQGDAAARKAQPIARGCLDYFPDALLAVAELSRIGNDQHNPGQPLHWAKEKSTDEADALMRHLIDRGKLDSDGVRHSTKVAWRALALLQREIDAERAK